MSQVLTASEICGQALGAIGAWPVTESAPFPEHLTRALTWLDLLMAQTAGTGRLFSRIDDTLSMSITNGTGSYDLYDALGSALPDDRINFVVEAHLQDSGGNRTPLTIVTRDTFENVSLPAQTGAPCWIYIDRQEEPTLQIYPTPSVDDSTTYTLKLVVQRYAPNVAPNSVNKVRPVGSLLHKMAQAWQRWLILQLSIDLGSGAIHKLAQQSLENFKDQAIRAKADLEAFENREQDTEAPICAPWGMD